MTKRIQRPRARITSVSVEIITARNIPRLPEGFTDADTNHATLIELRLLGRFANELRRVCRVRDAGEDYAYTRKSRNPDVSTGLISVTRPLRVYRERVRASRELFKRVVVKYVDIHGESRTSSGTQGLNQPTTILYRNAIEEMRYEIRQQRANRRQPEQVTKRLGDKYYALVGGVHMTAETFVGVSKAWRKSRLYNSKKPASAVNHVGVEIECFGHIDEDELADSFVEAGLDKHVEIKDDGSIRPVSDDECDGYDECDGEGNHDEGCSSSGNGGMSTLEICVLATEKEYADVVKRVCEVLNRHGARVNKSCGLHVHLDMRKRAVSKAYTNLVRALPVLTQMVPVQRRENDFCEVNESDDFQTQISNYRSRRYRAVNALAHASHKTLEVRLHSGTTNATKIINWASLLIRIANGKGWNAPVQSVVELFAGIRSTLRLRAWTVQRIKKFSKRGPSSLNEAAA